MSITVDPKKVEARKKMMQSDLMGRLEDKKAELGEDYTDASKIEVFQEVLTQVFQEIAYTQCAFAAFDREIKLRKSLGSSVNKIEQKMEIYARELKKLGADGIE